VLNTTLPTPVQAAPPVQAASPAQPRPPAQPQTLFQTQPLLQTTPAILPQPTAVTAAAPTPKPVDTTPQITVQPAGFAFSPGIVSCCPHPGLTRDGPNLGPRVELTLPTVEDQPLDDSLSNISRDGLPLRSSCSCQPIWPKQKSTMSAKRPGEILQNLNHWPSLGGLDV
jgi:hypothetical protein